MYMYIGLPVHVHLFHVTMEISVHSVENIPRYTALTDTVGRCDNLVYYLVMHAHMKVQLTHCECYMKQDSYILVTSVECAAKGQCTEVGTMLR